jgi:hypothetical protein
MKLAIASGMSIALAGCSIPRSAAEGGPVPGQIVVPDAKVLVLAVSDGQEQGQDAAPGSGQGMTTALRKALVAHAVPMSITEQTALSPAFDEATKGRFAYVLKSSITFWEDNATAWSGNGDKLPVSVELYNARSRTLAAAASHRRVATGATFASGSPNRFMDECATGALAKIYGWPKS